MDKTTLKALKGSIAKWEAIVAGTGHDNGGDNCPLCKMFLYKECHGCPVNEETGRKFCHGSPYEKWNEYHSVGHAQAELAFLKSLLPEGEEA
jgi:hypothetical protein